MTREPDTEYVLSLSYGKDSLACIEAIKRLGYPLDRIVHAEIWATDTIPADLPPMVEFKKKADKIIKERYGVEVEHFTAMNNGKKTTFESLFYKVITRSRVNSNGNIWGWPLVLGSWCVSDLKKAAIKNASKASGKKKVVEYIGIAADESERIARHTGKKVMPLVDIGWTEAECRRWCEENNLLSPIYTKFHRGGCWFCVKQSTNQLRVLRAEYPHLWALMLKWDKDAPKTFKYDGKTVADYDRRFEQEERGMVPSNHKFRWEKIEPTEDEPLLQYLEEIQKGEM